jgi:hypothetical protein
VSMGTTSQTTAVSAAILSRVAVPTSVTGMRALRFIPLALFVFALQAPASADSATEMEWFKAVTAKESAHLHQLPAFQRAGCDINVLVGPVIARSREPLLKAGDRILAINSQPAQGTPDTPFQLLNALSTGDIAHLKIERKGAVMTVNIPCKNAAVEIGARLAALDAAAQGRFAECSDAAADYEKQFVQSSGMYGLWRLCEVHAGHLTDDQYWSTLVTFWTLHLQELKYRPEAVDTERAKFLTALTGMVNAQQPLLCAEMRRQWTLATGESLEAPGPTQQAIARASIPVTVPVVPQRRAYLSSSSCESGHWVEEVMSDGEIVKLEDGSLWRVDATDTVDSALWLPSTDIVVCDGKLINTEDNESVEARRINE